MERKALDKLRAALHARRSELQAEGDLAIEPIKDDETKKVDEDAAPLTEMNQVIASNRNRVRAEELARIAEALERMREDPDDFGICEQCEEPIPSRRLELMPWVTLCAACQETREDGTRGGSRRHLTDYK